MFEDNAEFLKTVKKGDKVLVRDRSLGGYSRSAGYGYSVHTVKNVPPKRGYFVTVSADDREHKFDKWGSYRTGGYNGSSYSIQPLFEGYEEEIAADSRRIQAHNRLSRIEDDIRKLYQNLGNFKAGEIQRVLDITKELEMFLQNNQERLK